MFYKGHWGSWSAWGECDPRDEDYGWKTRNRVCLSEFNIMVANELCSIYKNRRFNHDIDIRICPIHPDVSISIFINF